MKCPYCESEETFTYYKTMMPTILSACPKETLSNVKIHPLEVKLCKNCGLGFNVTPLDDNGLKMIYDNYVYISPCEKIGHTKYEGILETLKKYYSKSDRLVEVGCSEGYLLYELKKRGFNNLLGIEPGPYAEDAKKLGLNIVKGYFHKHTFNAQIVDGFFLMHVFEHFSDPFTTLDAMKKSLSEKGKMVIEVPNFGGYHHQHLFYYNIHFIKRLCKDRALKIVDLVTGMGALRFVIVHRGNDDYEEVKLDTNINDVIDEANRLCNDIQNKIIKIERILEENVGKKIYWWGSGSASVIYLNQIDQGLREKVEIIVVDGDKKRSGYYIPGIDLKVNFYDILKNKSIDLIIIASSFYHEIKATMTDNNISAKNIEVIY